MQATACLSLLTRERRVLSKIYRDNALFSAAASWCQQPMVELLERSFQRGFRGEKMTIQIANAQEISAESQKIVCAVTCAAAGKLTMDEIMEGLRSLLARADACRAKGLDMWMAKTSSGREVWGFLDEEKNEFGAPLLTLFLPFEGKGEEGK